MKCHLAIWSVLAWCIIVSYIFELETQLKGKICHFVMKLWRFYLEGQDRRSIVHRMCIAMGYDFAPLTFENKMATSQPSWIRSILNFAHLYIQWLSTSFLFIMYINYDHGSHTLWNVWFWAKFSKQNGRQSAILDPIHLKFCTLIHAMIVYKFSIHSEYKLWWWVTKIMKFLILGEIQQTKSPPVGHYGSDPSQILHTYTFNDCLQVSYSLCIQITIMGQKNYEISDFWAKLSKQNGRQSAILDLMISLLLIFL